MKTSFLAVALLALLVLGARDLQAQAYGPYYYGPYWDQMQYQQYQQYKQLEEGKDAQGRSWPARACSVVVLCVLLSDRPGARFVVHLR